MGGNLLQVAGFALRSLGEGVLQVDKLNKISAASITLNGLTFG